MFTEFKTDEGTPCAIPELMINPLKKVVEIDLSTYPDNFFIGFPIATDIIEATDGFIIMNAKARYYFTDKTDLNHYQKIFENNNYIRNNQLPERFIKELLSLNLIQKIDNPLTNNLRIFSFPDWYHEKVEVLGWHTARPLLLTIDTTRFCNLKCTQCYNSSGSNHKIDPDIAEKLEFFCFDAIKNGVDTINFLGGEPFIIKSFLGVLRRAKNAGLRNITASTNGTLITEKNADEIAELFTNLQISIHGANPATHDKITGMVGSWEKAINAVMILNKRGLPLNASFTITEGNFMEIVDYSKLISDLGITPRFLVQFKGGRAKNALEGDFLIRSTEELKKAKELFPQIVINGDGAEDESLCKTVNDAIFYGCSGARTQLNISLPEEKTGICQRDFSINWNSNIFDIWYSPEFIENRKKLNCECDYVSVCGGTCKINCLT